MHCLQRWPGDLMKVSAMPAKGRTADAPSNTGSANAAPSNAASCLFCFHPHLDSCDDAGAHAVLQGCQRREHCLTCKRGPPINQAGLGALLPPRMRRYSFMMLFMLGPLAGA